MCAECATRRGSGRPYRRVDSCAGEVEAGSNYFYSTWGEEDEALPPATKPRVVIIGSGPNRIGQGIEFDYCCVHAVQTFRALGYEAVMINCNPETVSTDYDTSDRLYFEPLSPEEVLAVLDRERPEGVVTQFGGQTPLRLARHIEAAGYEIMGTPLAAIDLAEDRELFGALADELGIRCPPWATVEGPDQALAAAAEIGYPVLVRPSYVLGGRAMRVCYDDVQLREAMAAVSGSVLLDRFVENAVEIDVDALCDGEDVFIAAVMQHVEEAGVHSGRLRLRAARAVAHARERARGRAHRQAARARARRGRAPQHPACDRRLDGLRPGGEPAGLPDGSLRLEGDRDQPRRSGVQARRRTQARASSTCRRRGRCR